MTPKDLCTHLLINCSEGNIKNVKLIAEAVKKLKKQSFKREETKTFVPQEKTTSDNVTQK